MWSFLQSAGWPVWPLVFTSIITLALIIERAWATRSEQVFNAATLEQVLRSAHAVRTAPELNLMAQSSLLGLVLSAGLSCRLRDRPHLKEAFEIAGHKAAAMLEKNLSLLSMIATIAPLMGLLGTVVGMIEVFGSQSNLGADPQALAHGISVALYNTAFGLVIAIPAAVAHRFFRIRADSSLQQLEDAARALLDRLVTPAARPASNPTAGAQTGAASQRPPSGNAALSSAASNVRQTGSAPAPVGSRSPLVGQPRSSDPGSVR